MDFVIQGGRRPFSACAVTLAGLIDHYFGAAGTFESSMFIPTVLDLYLRTINYQIYSGKLVHCSLIPVGSKHSVITREWRL